MIVYSVTVSIDLAREADWVAWMRQTHLPEVMATGCFAHYRFCRLLNEEPGSGGATYNVHYLAPSLAHYDAYRLEHAPALQAKTAGLFAGQFHAFRTLLEVVEQNSYTDLAD